MKTPAADRAVSLARRLRRTTHYDIPGHLFRRIAALVGAAEVTYAEARIDRDSQFALVGQAVVLTEQLVVFADLDGVKDRRPGDTADSYTVKVRAWSRTELVDASLASSEADRFNSDNMWSEDWGTEWPPGCAITLTYRTGQSLQLPMSPDSQVAREALAQVLPTLMADLGGPVRPVP